MRTVVSVNAVYPIDGLLLSLRTAASRMFPAANGHQPSIRAQTAAHDVSIRSSTTNAQVVEGGRLIQ